MLARLATAEEPNQPRENKVGLQAFGIKQMIVDCLTLVLYQRPLSFGLRIMDDLWPEKWWKAISVIKKTD